jgi:hypothetical protein
VSEPLLIPTGQQAGTAWAAIRAANIAVRKSHSLSSDAIYVRRWNFLTPVNTQVRIAKVVSDDNDNIWLSTRPRFPAKASVHGSKDE